MNLKRDTIPEESFPVDALNASSHFYPNKPPAECLLLGTRHYQNVTLRLTPTACI